VPIAIPLRGTAAAELCNAHRDAILRTLKTAGQRMTLSDVADAIDATLSEAGQALELLRRAGFVDVERVPAAYGRCNFGITHAAAVL
jgi:predicted ArsR family transcriptional regulator